MMYYKDEIKKILNIIWTEFWPSNILHKSEDKQIRKTSVGYFTMVSAFFGIATCTTIQFMYQPFILGLRSLPLMLKLPFDVTPSPTYELLYVWNSMIVLFNLFSVTGFDFFFTMLIWNCVVQFKILRIVLKSIVVEDYKSLNSNFETGRNIEEEPVEEMAKLIKCIEHHKLLTSVCSDIQDMFKYILLFQLLDSSLGICFCCFAAVTVPSLFAKMVTFSMVYVMQLFLYCAFGSELQHQSTALSYSVFSCGWHYTTNKDLQKAIILFMQKAQKGQCLTARGFAIVNYESCLEVLRMAFSFYTLLGKIKDKL